MDSNEYQVTIKSANQKVDDYVTNCRPNWTVHRLKQHISATHVNKPNVEDQRLIYAGNLLKDSLTLKQIFFRDSLCTELTNSSKTDFTIHLVCSMKVVTSNNQRQNISGSNYRPPQVQSGSSSMPSTPASGSISTPVNTTMQSNITQTSIPSSAGSTTSTGPSRAQTSIPNTATSTTTSNNEHSNAAQLNEIVQNIMQSDQMRVQMAIFQQLASAVAEQMAQNLANAPSNGSNQTTSNQNNHQIPDLTPFFNRQLLNLPQGIGTQTDNHLVAATAAASQLLYAGNQPHPAHEFVTNPRSPGGVVNHQNENLNNENNAQAPRVDLFGGGGGVGGVGQMQAQAPVVVEQPQPAPVGPQIEARDVPVVDPAMQHDVIDWVYYSIRAVLFMAALYIHASLFRLLFIVGILAIAYFFNRRRTAASHRPRHNAPPAVQQQPPANANPALDELGETPRHQEDNRPASESEGGDAELRRRNVAGENDIPAARERQQVDGGIHNNNNQPGAADQMQAGPERVPFLKLCYLVVTDFLASLVPE